MKLIKTWHCKSSTCLWSFQTDRHLFNYEQGCLTFGNNFKWIIVLKLKRITTENTTSRSSYLSVYVLYKSSIKHHPALKLSQRQKKITFHSDRGWFALLPRTPPTLVTIEMMEPLLTFNVDCWLIVESIVDFNCWLSLLSWLSIVFVD